MEDVKKLLRMARLPHKTGYDEIFEENGYDDIHFLLELGPHELEILQRETGMPSGHFYRLKKALEAWRQQRDHPLDNLATGHYTGHGTGHAALPVVVTPAVFAASSTRGPQEITETRGPEVSGPNGPAIDESTPATAPVTTTVAAAEATAQEIPPYFKKGYTDWDTVRLVSLNHSTKNACSCCQDRKRSGGRYRIFICRSVAPKRSREEMESSCSLMGPPCPHELHWARNKGGVWWFLPHKSTIAHKQFCSSGQKVSQFELTHDPEFVKHVRTHKNVTGKGAADQALGHCGRMAGSVTETTARRARNGVRHWNLKDYEDDFCKMRPWGDEYESKNPGSRFRFHLEPGTNKFQRCFLSIAAMIHIAHGVGMRFSAVDACHSKHPIYRQGYLHLLTTRDGNNKIMVLAWAICETESGDTYKWFAQQCHDAGLSTYLNRGIIYSDRQKGIEQFHDRFAAAVGKCFKHLIGNAKDQIKGTNQTFQEATAWELQRAQTSVEFEKVLRRLKRESLVAGKYFEAQKPHNQIYQYAQNEDKIPTRGFKTSQIVECHNGVFVEVRKEHPYYLNMAILEWQGNKLREYHKQMLAWAQQGHSLTPWAHKEFQMQVCVCDRA